MLRTIVFLGISLVVVLTAICTFLLQDSQETFAAKYIDESSLATFFGGADWECGCETESKPCAQSPIYCLAGSCEYCESEAQKEHCVGWGWCIPYITCSDCIWDDDHDCGRLAVGSCINRKCVFQLWYGNCQTVAQCHTS